jgi:hypothetical protein
MTNTITFDFDYNHNIFETLASYYTTITDIQYTTVTRNGNPTICITFVDIDSANKFKTENHL